MEFIIAAIVLAIIVFILLGVTRDGERVTFKLRKRQLLSVLPLLLMVGSMVAVIPANSVGIRYSPFSGVSDQTLSEGWQYKGPFDVVYVISTEVQTRSLEQVTGQTKDSQYVSMSIDVKYRVNTDKAYEVFKQYRTLQNVADSLIAPTVQRSIEKVSTQYNIMEVLGEKRNEIYLGIETELTTRLAQNGISFVSINFDDTDAGDAIEMAIQNEAIAKKQVETAEQERQRAEIEAQVRVVEALANKEKAEIESETLLIEAKANAEANTILSQSITPELLAKMEMEARLQHGWITVRGGSVITDTRQGEQTPSVADSFGSYSTATPAPQTTVE